LILPITVQSNTVWIEIPISFLTITILFVLSNNFFFQETNILSRVDGAVLLIMFGAFLFYIFKQMKIEKPKRESSKNEMSNRKVWGVIIIGLAGLILGGKIVVDNAIDIATKFRVSEKIIGLTILAVGTSLPELVTSVVAALKKNRDIAIGNIIGSNIFNILFILSVSSFINPIEYNPSFNTDVYLLAGGTIFLFIAMFTGIKKRLDRWEAGVLFVIYILYAIHLIYKEI
jgi:cation:H+ antiporter